MQRLLFMIFPLDRTWTQTQSLWTPPPVTLLPHSWAYHGPVSHRLSWDVLQVKYVNPLILKKSSSRDMLLYSTNASVLHILYFLIKCPSLKPRFTTSLNHQVRHPHSRHWLRHRRHSMDTLFVPLALCDGRCPSYLVGNTICRWLRCHEVNATL